ncbi:U32 family peptidase [Desulfobotulus sp. H1]|uniref:U32 family peptidase n=1 Tax=Desulfobotulus pelophilus TaxID=2823377 RepID=A0ABT3N4P0_9BACT|nr:U32 family peptidase [Desulfobotulus pelophilus]MCW7752421.1 U32 family peptidase [Desulfobotulus pelophilus]
MQNNPISLPKPVELLAPAGNMEKLKIAIEYGADAVYLGGENFSLRNFSGNFSLPDIQKAITYTHQRNAKVYVACNVYPRNHELADLQHYLEELAACSPDALIVSDPGVIALARQHAPGIPLHLSTQANTTNSGAVRFWADNGVTRINAARELSLAEIHTLCKETIEVECFIHGAMCIAYSGRCLLSSYMADRDSNRGLCAHPCRWSYAVVEAKRPGHYFPVHEDSRGSYVFNSKDLCMIDHLPDLIRAGVSSVKIEGRMKSIHYLAVTVGAYREAIDLYYKNPSTYKTDPEWLRRLDSLHHRGYGTGFYLGNSKDTAPDTWNTAGKGPKALFIGNILTPGLEGKHEIICRNRFVIGDAVEILRPGLPPATDHICAMTTSGSDSPVDTARPNERLLITLKNNHPPFSLIRILHPPCQNHFFTDIVPYNG